jgi:hypothetical protein
MGTTKIFTIKSFHIGEYIPMIINRIFVLLFCFTFIYLQISRTAIASDQYLYVISSKIKIFSKDNSTLKTDKNLFGEFFQIESRDSLYYKCSHKAFGNCKFLIQQYNIDYLKNSFGSNCIYASKVSDTNIFQKIVFIIPPQPSMNTEKNNKLLFFDNPILSGNPIGEVDILQWPFAYCFAKTDQAILIGKANRISKSSGSVMIGWVDKKNIVMWNNRLGIEFNKNNYHERKKCGIGKIYYSQKGLLQNNSNNIFTKEKDTDSYLPHYANRFPVLHVSNNGEMIKTVATQEYIDDMKKSKNESGLIKKLIDHKKVQIAIVIDSSIVTLDSYKNLILSINQFFQQYPKILSKDFTPELALIEFHKPNSDQLVVELKCHFTDKQTSIIDAMKKKPKHHSVFTNNPIKPINFALDTLKWHSNKLGEKFLLFVIGGNSLRESNQNNKNTNSILLGTLLKEKAISLNVLKLNSHLVSSKKSSIFDSQINEILSANDNFGNYNQMYYNRSKQLVIFESLKQILNQYVFIREHLQRITEHHWFTPHVISSTGYVNKYNQCKQKQIIVKVLMQKKEIEALKVNLQTLSDSIIYFDPYESPNEFDNVIYRIVKALTGDRIREGESISSFISKKNALPFKTEFLNKSLTELKNELNTKEKRLQIRRYIEEKLVKLEEVTREQVIDIGNWDDEDKTFHWNATNKYIPYFFSLEHPYSLQDQINNIHKRFAWVPLEYLP